MKKRILSVALLSAIIPGVWGQSEGNNSLTNYVLILMIVVLVGYFFISKRHMLMSIIRMFSGSFRTAKDNPLTPEQQRKILLGSIYSLQQGGYLDSLRLDVGGNRAATILQDWWGIHGKDSAKETLDYLRDKGHRFYFAIALDMMKQNNWDQQKEVILSNVQTQEDAEKTVEYFKNLTSSIEEMKKDGTITSDEDLKRLGVTGWDAGRLSFMARLCHDAKLITEEEVWAYLDAADRIARENLRSWKDLADSYVLGRYFWTGADGNSSAIRSFANDLLKKPNSPWNTVPF